MKLLKRIRLINWHYFYNINVEVDRINFLTGENASGKSTLIDALQVVLLGDTSGRTFNKAANEKAGRTLKGYLRGEIGDDGANSYKYLRNGRFSSYICLEFYDDIKEKSFTLGIVFDSFDDGTEEHHFFILEDKFPHCDFISLNVPMSYRQLSDYFAENYKSNEYTFADTNAHYQSLLKDKLGGLKNKYFSLFKKAVSFIPITNIEQFITEYVCDVPNEIDITSMRNNIQNYKRLEIEAESMQEKINKLEEISKVYLDYSSRKEEMNLASYISKRITYQVYLNTISTLQHDVESSENRIKDIDREIVEIENQIADLDKQKELYIGQKVSSGAYKLTNDLKNARDRAKEQIEILENQVKTLKQNFYSYINEYTNSATKTKILAENLLLNKNLADFKSTFTNLKDYSDRVITEGNLFKTALTEEKGLSFDLLKNFREATINYKNLCVEIIYNVKNKVREVLDSNNYISSQINDSSHAGKMYDYQLLQVQSQLKHALEDHFSEEVKVLIYADLVDIKDMRWAKAIEGYIYSQKLNMFVDDRYYEAANRILPEILRRNNYYRTGLVDSAKLSNQNFAVDDGSLAEEISTNHQGARDYSNFLLGKMLKCETFKEARACGRGITPDATGYRNFASFVIPERNYRYFLIGRQVSKETLALKKQEMENNKQLITSLKALLDVLEYVRGLDTINSNEFENAKQVLQEAESLEAKKINLRRYEDELSNAGSQEISTIDNQIKHLEQEISNLQNDKQELLLEKGSLTNNIATINEEKIPNQVKQSSELMDEIKRDYNEEFIESKALPLYNSEVATGDSLVDIRRRYDDVFIRNQNKLRSLFSALGELRKEYVLEYKLSYDISKITNEDFDNELTMLRDVKLPSYKAKIQDAYQKATKEFKDDFIFKLKTCIEQVRTQIDELNEALKDAKFGQDSYQFTVTPAPQYKEYYDMITDDLLLSYGEDENLYMEKYSAIMANLFKLIGDVSGNKDENSMLEQNVEKFTDYRTYLLFDLLVHKEEGKTYSLSRNIKKASGGETQTPFYISILASFAQLYRIKRGQEDSNTIRLVVFDEAFSKMDSARIIESIKILKNFGLQVILSAPPEKVSELSKIVDKTLLVSRQKGRSYIDQFVINK